MSLRLYGRMKEEKKCSELLISPLKKESRLKEEKKKMLAHELSPSIYEYVMGIYKGSGETLGNIATQARQFEYELNAYNEELDLLEGYEDER